VSGTQFKTRSQQRWNFVGSGAFDGTVSLSVSKAAADTKSGPAKGSSEPVSTTGTPELSDLSFVERLVKIFGDGFESGDTRQWSASVP